MTVSRVGVGSSSTRGVFVDLRDAGGSPEWFCTWAFHLLEAVVAQAPDLEFTLLGSTAQSERLRTLSNRPNVEFLRARGVLTRWHAARLMAPLRPALVHSFGLWAPRLRSARAVIVTTHRLPGGIAARAASSAGSRWASGLTGLRGRRALRAATRIVATSSEIRNALVSELGLPASHVHVILGGVDHVRPAVSTSDTLQPIFAADVTDVRPPILAVLLDAFATVAAQLRAARLDLVSATSVPQSLRRQVSRSPLHTRVQLFDCLDASARTVVAQRASAYIALLPDDGSALPVAEALQLGCPVVAPDTGAAREVAARAAIYVDPFDADGLASAMLDLARNPPLQQALRDAGLARAGLFTWERAAAQLVSVYRECLAAPRSNPRPAVHPAARGRERAGGFFASRPPAQSVPCTAGRPTDT